MILINLKKIISDWEMDILKTPLVPNSICKLSALLIKFPQAFFFTKIHNF